MRIIGGEWAGRRIEAPAGRATRPTSDRLREAWMSAVASQIPDARVLDLYAGSGALGLEALSRGAASATFVERAPAALKVLERNIAALRPSQGAARVVRGDALDFARRSAPREYDIAFADPPYADRGASDLVAIYESNPFAGLLCIEHGRDEPISSGRVVWRRRYGDTELTFLDADAPSGAAAVEAPDQNGETI